MWHIDIKDTTKQYLNVYLQKGKLSPSCDFWSTKEFRLLHVSLLNFILFLSCHFYAHHRRWENGSNIKKLRSFFPMRWQKVTSSVIYFLSVGFYVTFRFLYLFIRWQILVEIFVRFYDEFCFLHKYKKFRFELYVATIKIKHHLGSFLKYGDELFLFLEPHIFWRKFRISYN